MRDLTAAQEAVYTGAIVQRQLLIEVTLDKKYYFSTREDSFMYNGNVYLAGHIRDPMGPVESEQAEFSVWNENFKHTRNAKNGAYRQGEVVVMDGRNAKKVVPYVEDGYHEAGYTVGNEEGDVPEPIVLHEGIIYATTPTIDGWLDIISRTDPFNFYPSKKLKPPFANHLPMEGDTFAFNGAILTIEGE